MNKAIFLDRDGVINGVKEDEDFIYRKGQISIIPGVKNALKILKDKGYKIFVITNQPVIARGIVSIEEVEKLHDFMNKRLGGRIDKFYICPHHPEMHSDVPEHAKKYRIKCDCRKPSPGMLLRAAEDFNINLKESWMIGDMITDIVTGKNAGCKTIFVSSPHSKRIIKSHTSFDQNIKADINVKSLSEAINLI